MEIHLDGHIPQEHIEEFIKMIRHFDHTHENCHFDMVTNDDTQTVEAAREMMYRVFGKDADIRTTKTGGAA